MRMKLHCQRSNIYPDPEQIFSHFFKSNPFSFWLDSSLVQPGVSRFSFMGDNAGPNSQVVMYNTVEGKLTRIQHGEKVSHSVSIFDYLRTTICETHVDQDEELPFAFNGGFVGYFGYELKAELGANLVHRSSLPDACFILADRFLCFDHEQNALYFICLSEENKKHEAEKWFEYIENQLKELPQLFPLPTDDSAELIDFTLSCHHDKYLDNIKECLRKIGEGETYEVCLTNKVQMASDVDPFLFYRVLRNINPAPYAGFLRLDDLFIACCSPESFLRVDRYGWVESRPMKGTMRRGGNASEDQELREKLANSTKDRAENLMIVDLVRNDIGRVCEIGSVHVPKLMEVETFATVHQMVSTIRGKLRSNCDGIDCIKAAFPGGSMTGAPKLRTMEIVDCLENEARGVYSGSIGFLAFNHSVDLNIVIRTAVMTPEKISIGTGGAIVALSDADEEYQEITLKAKAMIRALSQTKYLHHQGFLNKQ